MWDTKEFKSKADAEKWIARNEHKYQWEQIFVNNVPYAITYKKLRIIEFDDD